MTRDLCKAGPKALEVTSGAFLFSSSTWRRHGAA